MELRMEGLKEPLREFTAALAKFQEDLGAFLQEAGVEPEGCGQGKGSGRRGRGRLRKREASVGPESDLIEILSAVASSVQPLRDLVTWALDKEVKIKVEVKEEPEEFEEGEGNGAFQELMKDELDPALNELDLPFILHPEGDNVAAKGREYSDESDPDLNDPDPSSDPASSDLDWIPSSPENNNLQRMEEEEASGSTSKSSSQRNRKPYLKRRWPPILQDPTTYEFICPAPSCGARKASATTVLSHMKGKHPELRQRREGEEEQEKPKGCTVCGKTFVWRNSLLEHQRRHEKEAAGGPLKPFLCDKCPAAFREKRSLRLHIERIHVEGRGRKKEVEGPLPCEKCGKEFSNKKNLSHHVLRVHPSKEKMKLCSYCGAKFKSSKGLNVHVKEIHLMLKPFQCPDCPSVFPQRYKLVRHQVQVHVKQGKRRLQTQRKKRKEESSL